MNKLIRYVLLTILINAFYFKANSQALYPVSLDEKVEQSTLIVEGKVKQKTSFWNDTHTMIYTSNTIEVYKIFKGSLVADTIEVMTQGGAVGDYDIEVSDVLDLNMGDVGLFFCLPNQINLNSPVSHQSLWDIYSSAQGCLKYYLTEGSASAPFAKYADVQNQFYPQLQQRTNRQPQIINQSFRPYAPHNLRTSSNPVISSFSPAIVKAGSYDEVADNVLTINGSGFGTATGSAGINFDNPDDGTGGTPFFVAATSDLVISWADTQIVVRVPAKVGTGIFSVVEAGGTSGNSPTNLQVKYAILNGTYGSAPIYRQYNLMDFNGSGGYDFVYSTGTGGGGVDFTTSSQRTTFERALSTWQEVTGLNFSYIGTTASQLADPTDGINTILMDNTNTGKPLLSAGILALTYSSGSSCAGTQFTRRNGFDIIVRNPGVSLGSTNFNLGPCSTSTSSTEYDLETVLLHELGHALNLGHINDTYLGTFPNIDPAKLMNYAIFNGADRRSPDWSSLAGAQYCINPRGISYGSCNSFSEMTPLTAIVESKDECPGSFPSTATTGNTLVAFDLAHATSNKNGDPQLTAVNCSGTGTAITNNAYYAVKTNSTGGAITLTVSGYTTTTSDQSTCSGLGVELAMYQTSSCPAGQSFPSPVACRTFNADGTLASFTGLAANTNYLIMVDGISNTKANFNLLINGSALALKITYFTGNSSNGFNTLNWKAENIISVDKISLEGSLDGVSFTELYQKDIAGGATTITDSYNDYEIAAAKYYRIKIYNTNGSTEFSNTILLKQNSSPSDVVISPNPVTNFMNVTFYQQDAGQVTFNLSDITGKLLSSQKIIAQKGEQTVKLAVPPGIAKGNYVFQINSGTTTSSHKIIIQ